MKDLGGSRLGWRELGGLRLGWRELLNGESSMAPGWDGGSWATPRCDRKKSTDSVWDGGSYCAPKQGRKEFYGFWLRRRDVRY